MPQYLIKMVIPIDGDTSVDALMKFRDWLADPDEPFRPFVSLMIDTSRFGGGAEGDPVVLDFDMQVMEWFHRASKEFMEPQVEYFEEGELELPELDDEEPGSSEAGWYGRLSAPGYMDCTDWNGPHETELDAMISLYELYGT